MSCLAGERHGVDTDATSVGSGGPRTERAVVAQRRLEVRGLAKRLLHRVGLARRHAPRGRPSLHQLVEVREAAATHHVARVAELEAEEVAHAPQQARRRTCGCRMRDRHGDELAHARGIEEGRGVRRARAPVVPHDDRLLLAQRLDEREEIATERVRVVPAVAGDRRRRITAREDGDRTKPRFAERGTHAVPRVRRVRKAVHEKHERTLARLEVAEPNAVGGDEFQVHGRANPRPFVPTRQACYERPRPVHAINPRCRFLPSGQL